MTKDRRWDNSDWPKWVHEAWNSEPSEGAIWIDPDDPKRERLFCGTLEGVCIIEWGDWIIRGVKGEIYTCKPDIFEQTYNKTKDPHILKELKEINKRLETIEDILIE